MSTLCSSSSSLVAATRMSSTILLVAGTFSMTGSDRMHHSSPAGASPMGQRRYLYLPCGRRNVVRSEDSSSRGIWWYPARASILQKTLEPFGILLTMSAAVGNGFGALAVARFKAL